MKTLLILGLVVMTVSCGEKNDNEDKTPSANDPDTVAQQVDDGVEVFAAYQSSLACMEAYDESAATHLQNIKNEYFEKIERCNLSKFSTACVFSYESGFFTKDLIVGWNTSGCNDNAVAFSTRQEAIDYIIAGPES